MQSGGTDFALVVFDHTEGAERAYADAPKRVRDIDWAQAVAFVAHHSRDRLVIPQQRRVLGAYPSVLTRSSA